jgi:hypothetical protein
LGAIDLALALKHTETLKVDWDILLTEEETQFVLGNLKYFRKISRLVFRPFKCEVCGEVDETKLSECGSCHQVLYCCREHQKEDWAEHKKHCAQFEMMMVK